MRSTYFSILSCLVIAGCSTPEQQADNLPFKKNALVMYSDSGGSIHDALEPLCDKRAPRVAKNKSKSGVAIVGGLGFNYAYDDPRASEAVLHAAGKLAEALQEEMKRCSVTAGIHLNKRQGVDIRSHTARALSENRNDGLIQIALKPEKVGDGSALFVSFSYLALQRESDPSGERVTTLPGPSRKYQVNQNAQLVLYARKFAAVLQEDGYIGN